MQAKRKKTMAKLNQTDLTVIQVLLKNEGKELTLKEIANKTGRTPKAIAQSLWKLFNIEPLL